MAVSWTRPLRVLLVDDQEGDLLLMRSLLRAIGGAGYELDWAATLGEALATFRQGAVHDVLLVDYRLGPCTGLDLRRELDALGCRAPMLILSAYADAEIERRSLEGGAAACLDKRELTPARLERAIAKALARAERGQPAPAADATSARARVLVVEDEPALRELWREVLGDAGWEVLDAASGEAAMSLLDTERVDAALADLRMPGLSGLALVYALRARVPAVVAISGAEIEPEVADLVDTVLTKPVGLEIIRAAMARAIDRRRATTA
jgi:CheY-like chemotaxis protein